MYNKAATNNEQLPLFLQLSCWACSLGGLLFGYGTSIISDALHFMRADLHLSPDDNLSPGLLTSSLLVGAALGSLVWGRIADGIGRRRAMCGLCLLFIVGCLCASLAPTFNILLPARVLNGFSIGGFSAVSPILIAELAPAQIRAQMVTRNTLFIVSGQMAAFIVGALLGSLWPEQMNIWRWMNGLGLVPGVLLLLCSLFFIPESPRWLVSVGKPHAALAILRRVRANPLEADAELETIKALQQEETAAGAGKIGCSKLVTERWLRNCALLGLAIAFSQQALGVAAPMYYGTEILERVGMETQLAMVLNISIGVMSVVALLLGLWLSGRLNRRPMLLVGFFGSAVAHLLTALSCWLLPQGNLKGIVVLCLLLLFCLFMQASVTTVTWSMLAEIFPLRARGIIMGFCTVAVWMTKFTHGLLLPLFMNWLGIPATFLILLAFSLLSAVFVWFLLPETRGKSLEELEEQFKAEDWAALKRGPSRPMGRTRTMTETATATAGGVENARF